MVRVGVVVVGADAGVGFMFRVGVVVVGADAGVVWYTKTLLIQINSLRCQHSCLQQEGGGELTPP